DAADEQFRFIARVQEVEIVNALVHRLNWHPEANHSLYAIIGTGDAKPYGSSESESHKNQRELEFAIEPLQRSVYVFGFSFSVAVLSCTQPKPRQSEA